MKKTINIFLVIICLVSSFFAKAQGLGSNVDSSSDNVKLELIDENGKDLILIPMSLALTLDTITKKLTEDNNEIIKNEIINELKDALTDKEVKYCALAGSFYSSESQGIHTTINKCHSELKNPSNFNEIVTDYKSIEELQLIYSRYLHVVISGANLDFGF